MKTSVERIKHPGGTGLALSLQQELVQGPEICGNHGQVFWLWSNHEGTMVVGEDREAVEPPFL